jgi:hypothetical protein
MDNVLVGPNPSDEDAVLSDADSLAALRALLHSEHTAGPDELPDLMTHAGRLVCADEVELYLVDYDQTMLLPLTSAVDEGRPFSAGFVIEKTLPGRAFSDMRQEVSSAADGWLVWTPVSTERPAAA